MKILTDISRPSLLGIPLTPLCFALVDSYEVNNDSAIRARCHDETRPISSDLVLSVSPTNGHDVASYLLMIWVLSSLWRYWSSKRLTKVPRDLSTPICTDKGDWLTTIQQCIEENRRKSLPRGGGQVDGCLGPLQRFGATNYGLDYSAQYGIHVSLGAMQAMVKSLCLLLLLSKISTFVRKEFAWRG